PFSPRSCWRTHALSHGDSMADKRTPAVERRPAHARRSGARRAGEGAMKRLALLLLALCLPLAAAGAATLEPFAASYTIRWGGMNAGTGTLRLDRIPGDNTWSYESRLQGRGLFRLALPSLQISRSTFRIE